MTEAPTPANIFNLGFGFWASKALLSAVELGLFTKLAKGRPILPICRNGSGCIVARRAIFSTTLSR